MNVARLARPEIRALKPYEAAVQVTDTIRLNANEAPWSSSSDTYRRPLNRYPEIRPQRLRERLADHYRCPPEKLLVTRGSSEAIDLLLRVFCRAGVDSIVTTTPTFSMYRHYAAIQGAKVREVRTVGDNDFAVEADAILDACDDSTRLIFLCSPNNPTGTLLDDDVLRRVLAERSDRSVVVLDEAYIEFSGQASAVELLATFDNLVILRTLSKALAFAGARCGAVIGPAAVISMLNAVQAPYALATPVVESVEAALEPEVLRDANRAIDEVVTERRRLGEALARMTFVRRIWPSAGNFLLLELDGAEEIMERTHAAGILLRDFSGSLANCVRISIGSPAENDRLLELCKTIEESHSGS